MSLPLSFTITPQGPFSLMISRWFLFSEFGISLIEEYGEILNIFYPMNRYNFGQRNNI